MLTLTLFGTPMVEGPEGPITGRGARGHRLALLALLAVSRGRPVARDRVVALLWPEARPNRARAQLSDAVYLVRGALGESAILSTGDDLALNPEMVTSDVGAFHQAIADGRAEVAVGLVGGPFLDGFHLPDSNEFEQWLSRERAAFQSTYTAALESLASACDGARDHAGATRWWRQLAALDPGNGRVALRLMQALESSGDRVGALRFAREHAELLREEFDTVPDPEVAAHEERLRRAPRGRVEAIVPVEPALEPQPSPTVASIPAPLAAARPGEGRRAMVRRFAALALLAIGVWVVGAAPSNRASAGSSVEQSVAVLPFANLSADSADAYFSDGISELVIAALGGVERLRVAARNSSFAFRDSDLDLRRIGDTLGVQSVLEGTVLRTAGRLRVTARLRDAATGDPLWSAEYDREQGDVVAVQEEIARAIAGALELRLRERRTAGTLDGAALEAYDRYLRGLYLRNSLSGDGLRQAAAHFDRAIALDPHFAPAYAGKASVIAPLIYYDEVPLESGVAQMRALTARALELDPRLADAYAALGILKLFFEWDWEGAGQALSRAIELNPNDAHAHHHMANYFTAMDRPAEEVAARERSAALDPLNARSRYMLAVSFGEAGQHDRALEEFQRALQIDPLHPMRLGMGPGLPATPGFVHMNTGHLDDAIDDFLRVAMLRNAAPDELDAMRRSYDAQGMPGFWRAFREMDARQANGAPNALRSAKLSALSGDTAAAIEALERAYAERNPGLIFIRRTLTVIGLQGHPEAMAIVRRMNFPER